MNGYELSKRWWEFAFQYPGKRTPTHAALYHWLIEWANRLGWPAQFDMAPPYAMAAIGVSSHNTYDKVLADLCAWGFVELVQKGRNQYAPMRLALSKNDKAIPEMASVGQSSGLSKNDRPPRNSQHDGLSKNDKANQAATSRALSDALSKNDRPNPFATSKIDNPRDDYTINKKETKTKNKNTSNVDSTVDEIEVVAEVVEQVSDEDELAAFTEKLTGNRRLHEALSRNLNLRDGDDRHRWITDFVFDQWAKSRLGDRNNTDLISHCQSWISIKLKLANEPERTAGQSARPAPYARRNARSPRGHADTGAEIDRLIDDYYRT